MFKTKIIQTCFGLSTSGAETIQCIWLQLPLHFCNLISLRCIMSNNYLNEDSNGRSEENNRDVLKKWSCEVALVLSWHWFSSLSFGSCPYRDVQSLSKVTCFRCCSSDGFFASWIQYNSFWFWNKLTCKTSSWFSHHCSCPGYASHCHIGLGLISVVWNDTFLGE